jgi:hypothetical protein
MTLESRLSSVVLLLVVVSLLGSTAAGGDGHSVTAESVANRIDHSETEAVTQSNQSTTELSLDLTTTLSGNLSVAVENTADQPVRGLVITITLTAGKATEPDSVELPPNTTLSKRAWPGDADETTVPALVWRIGGLDDSESNTLSIAGAAEPFQGTAGAITRIGFEATAREPTNDATGERIVGSDRVTVEERGTAFYVDAPPTRTPTPTPPRTPISTTATTTTSLLTGFGFYYAPLAVGLATLVGLRMRVSNTD